VHLRGTVALIDWDQVSALFTAVDAVQEAFISLFQPYKLGPTRSQSYDKVHS